MALQRSKRMGAPSPTPTQIETVTIQLYLSVMEEVCLDLMCYNDRARCGGKKKKDNSVVVAVVILKV